MIFLALALILWPGMAAADPLTALIASGLGSIGISGVAGEILASLLGSVVLSAASRALQGRGKASAGAATALELQQPTSQPPYRFVYGQTRATGTPTGLHVKGNILYGCWILNSRPSAGPFTLLLDKRIVTLTGDPHDFATGGATATASPFAGFVKVWIGRGDQTTAPAQIVAEAPEFYASSDAWRGLTVVWLRLDAGDASSRAERWSVAPPELAVDGKFCKLWDPRDLAQSPTDATTWTWSDNQALAVLDALLHNPVTPYDLRQIDLTAFKWAADVADEAVTVLAGGTIPRYRVAGTLVFAEGSELEDQLQPLLDAGASQWVRARGQLGIVPATVQTSALTLTDLLDDQPPTFVRYRSRDELFTEVAATYLAPDRAYEDTEAPVYVIPGAQAEDGGIARRLQPDLSMITDHRQAQRVQRIMALRTRAQRVITGTFPPDAFQVVAGSWVTLNLPAPFTGWNGIYQVEALQPAVGGNPQDDGVHLRCGLTLREVSSSIYAWSAASDEQTVAAYTLDASLPVLAPPGAVTTTTGAAVAVWTGSVYAPAIRFACDPSPSAAVVLYEWQYQVAGGAWTPGGTIDGKVRDGASKVFGVLTGVSLGLSYSIRVRAVGASASAFVTSAPVTVTLAGARYDANYAAGTYALDGSSVAQAAVLQLTRTSAATYLNNSGSIVNAAANVARVDYLGGTPALLVEPAATNVALWSADMSNAAWIKTSVSIASAGSSVISGQTAWSMTEAAATANHVIRQERTIAAGQVQTIMAIAKAGSGSARWLGLSMQSVADATKWVAARFDLSSGVVTSTDVTGAGFTLTGTDIRALGGGWYLCALTGVIGTATDFRARVAMAASGTVYSASQGGSQSYLGDGTSNILLAGVQIEEAATWSSFILTTTAAVTRAADVPGMLGIIGTLNLLATYGDGSTAAFSAAPVVPGYWPTLAQTRLRRLNGTI